MVFNDLTLIVKSDFSALLKTALNGLSKKLPQ